VLAPLMQVGASADLLHRALNVHARWRFGFHDALIIAAALAAGCTRLLSEDLQHGQRIETLTIVDPFRV
jgi:predicted nucleic acid-binding protein